MSDTPQGYTELSSVDAITVSSEDCLVMSLVENLARRQHHSFDLLRDFKRLKDSGYSVRGIATKTQLSTRYVHGVIRLLESHEHRLFRAVESEDIPVSLAVDIVEADDIGIQTVLRNAYENKVLQGGRLMAAKRLIDARKQKRRSDSNALRPRLMRSDLSNQLLLPAIQATVNYTRSSMGI